MTEPKRKNPFLYRTADGTRKRGKPKRGSAPVTPKVLEEIGELYLKGVSVYYIAKQIGVDHKAIRYHLKKRLQPFWKQNRIVSAEEDLARVMIIERLAWQKFDESCKPQTKAVVKKALLEGGSKLEVVERILSAAKTTGEIHWIDLVKWCVEFRAKIGGYYAPAKVELQHSGELRIAGMSPEEVDKKMIKRLTAGIEERRQFACLQRESELEGGLN